MNEFLQQIINGVMVGSTYAVVALGFGLQFSVMRVLNLAHPEIFVLGMYTTAVVAVLLNVPAGLPLVMAIGTYVLVLAVVAGVTGAAGLLVERLVLRPTRGTYFMIPFIATAGVALALQNGIQRIFGADPVPIPNIVPVEVIHLGGAILSTSQLVTLITAFTIMLAMRYYVRSTKWGRATRAVAEWPDVAAASGVDVNRLFQLTVGISSVMAGAAGVSLAFLYGSASPFIGLLFGVKSFVCMLIAGNRHPEGIIAVGLILGVTEAMVTGYVTSSLRDAVAFTLLLTVLVFRPKGLFGSYEL